MKKLHSRKQMKRKKGSILQKIYSVSVLTMLPFIVIAIIAIATIHNLYEAYDQSVSNITQINEYNLVFERNMNSSMYYIIVEAYDIDDLKDSDDVRNPYVLIKEMQNSFNELRSSADSADSLNDIDAVLRTLRNLKKQVDQIVKNVRKGGYYDENMQLLNSNIYVLTSLIQGDIEDYVYHEAALMETMCVRIASGVRTMIIFLSISVIGMAMGMLFVSYRLSRKITDPIEELCGLTEEFSRGDFSARCEIRSGDEMEVLAGSFNSMGGEISNLIEDIRIEQKNSKEMEQKLLQEQINPHFLYNTLDAIMWLVEAGQNRDAVRMISSLSSFFRTTLSKGRDWITVAEEEMHITSYLEIQHFRYQNIMNYEIHIPEEMKHFYLLKLMLQPLVENALYHGLKNKRTPGTIVVIGKEDHGDLVFTVEDDGIGMTGEELRHLRQTIEGADIRNIEETGEDEESGFMTDQSRHHGFGLVNVQNRIRLNYGEKYGISVESTYGEGSRFTVVIPAVERPPEVARSVREVYSKGGALC